MFFKNQITIEGRLTKNPEPKLSPSGVKYARFSICYNQSKKDRNTEQWENIPHFFNCVTFKKMADTVATYKKGDPVTISGILQSSKWEKDGEKRSDISILVNDIKLLNIPKKNVRTEDSPAPSAADFPNAIEKYGEDEIPF